MVKQLDAAADRAAAAARRAASPALGLAGLPPGDYELVLKVTDEIAGQSVERREPLAILPSPSRSPASAGRQP